MNINVKCLSSLHNNETCRHDRDNTISLSGDTSTVKNLAEHLEVREQDISLVFVNGRRSGIDDHLSDGDRVAFVPAVGGM